MRGLFIELDVDPSDEVAATIKGQMRVNPHLEPFNINKNKMFPLPDLIQMLKMNRIHFADREKLATTIANLQKFKAKIETDLKQEGDDRGNKSVSIDVKVTADAVPADFTLKMPLYVGGKETTFKVEVCFESRDRGLSFWLESVELAEALVAQAKESIDAELKLFPGFVIIES